MRIACIGLACVVHTALGDNHVLFHAHLSHALDVDALAASSAHNFTGPSNTRGVVWAGSSAEDTGYFLDGPLRPGTSYTALSKGGYGPVGTTVGLHGFVLAMQVIANARVSRCTNITAVVTVADTRWAPVALTSPFVPLALQRASPVFTPVDLVVVYALSQASAPRVLEAAATWNYTQPRQWGRFGAEPGTLTSVAYDAESLFWPGWASGDPLFYPLTQLVGCIANTTADPACGSDQAAVAAYPGLYGKLAGQTGAQLATLFTGVVFTVAGSESDVACAFTGLSATEAPLGVKAVLLDAPLPSTWRPYVNVTRWSTQDPDASASTEWTCAFPEGETVTSAQLVLGGRGVGLAWALAI